MENKLAIKVSNNIFLFQLIGYGTNIVYNRADRQLMICDAETGAPLKIEADSEDLFFEDFVLVARNMYLDLVELGNGYEFSFFSNL